MTADDVADFEKVIAGGGIALFPADTVYGLAVDPESDRAVRRLYELKGRPARRPAAVMFFDLESALAALPSLPERTAAALRRLLPGRVTAIVPNPDRRYPLVCGPDPDTLGLRVPDLSGEIEPLAAMRRPVMQSSANLSGGSEARRLVDVDPTVRAGADLEIDGGELPGVASTVVDLSEFEAAGGHRIAREGAVPAAEIAALLARE